MTPIFINKKIFYAIILILVAFNATAQDKPAINSTFMRWEGSVSSGLYADLYYSNLRFGGGDSDPASYSTIPGKRVQFGKTDRFEVKYNLDKKAAVSLNFSQALWRDLYGTNNDPLELWTETRKYNKRILFAANYYRNFYTKNQKGSFNIGLGLMVKGEQSSHPYYRNYAEDPTLIYGIDAYDRSFQWWDLGPQLTASYYYAVNQNLKIGLSFQTLYGFSYGTDGAGLMGSIAVPFHKVKKSVTYLTR